jgi:mannose-6-phosphate isomerase-like protein (cupin superfamily)
MTGRVPATAAVALVIGYLAGLAGGKAGVAAQQPTTQTAPPAWASIPLAPNQGDVVHWPAADLQKTHAALAARSNGRILSKPRDLVPLPMTRTHMFDVVHRPQTTGDATAEQHEGVTDLYVILGGSGKLTVGGEITNRQVIPNRPGEYTGRPITGGRTISLKPGDIVAVPPNTPHATVADAGGVTYMLIKVNVGLYPWSLVSGAQ